VGTLIGPKLVLVLLLVLRSRSENE
jgi:hypothetical protein